MKIGLRLRDLPAWAALTGLTVLCITVFELVSLPAASMLGGIVAAIFFAMRDTGMQVPAFWFCLGQCLIGCLIASSLSLSVLRGILDNWLLALGVVMAGVVCGFVLGWFMTVRRLLPGTTGIWGTSPGAATAMTLMSGSYGADMRLVAFMQYLRVVMVSIAAALVAWVMGAEGMAQRTTSLVGWLFPSMNAISVAETLALAVGCTLLSQRLRITSPILPALFIGAAAQNLGLVTIELPRWLQMLNFVIIGWAIGLRFNRSVFLYAIRALPKILTAILIMIGLTGAISVAMVLGAGIDPLTAYLAASPGGVDSVAIIAASSGADMAFVMSIQTARMLLVILTGPALARFATSRIQRHMHIE